MKELNNNEMQELNGGGRIYVCPTCNKVTGSYWKVYRHALFSGCFKRNRYLRWLWGASCFCFSTALSNELTRMLNVSFYRGKHYR